MKRKATTRYAKKSEKIIIRMDSKIKLKPCKRHILQGKNKYLVKLS
tara:strand:- start:8081 stop:8218 length:138 start_codon:yes stop_codon:yes gene_type:complete